MRALTDDGRLVFAGAASGSGYRLAPAIARETVRLLSAQTPSRKATEGIEMIIDTYDPRVLEPAFGIDMSTR